LVCVPETTYVFKPVHEETVHPPTLKYPPTDVNAFKPALSAADYVELP